MRYAIFTDIHANLEALQAVLAKIDEIAIEEPIDQIWFLGDLVGYGPDPNECIRILRERTDIIIAGNHDWAAVGKIDLEDFSAAARISAEWTAEQLTPEYRDFLANLPERLEIEDFTLVHGSPFGPLWEYLTSEALAERSFLYFNSRYCLVGHTHVPVIFIQPDSANIPTLPLSDSGQASDQDSATAQSNGANNHHQQNGESGPGELASMGEVIAQAENPAASPESEDNDETVELVTIPQPAHQSTLTAAVESDTAHASALLNPDNASHAATGETGKNNDPHDDDDGDDDETEPSLLLLQEIESAGQHNDPVQPGDDSTGSDNTDQDDDESTEVPLQPFSAISSEDVEEENEHTSPAQDSATDVETSVEIIADDAQDEAVEEDSAVSTPPVADAAQRTPEQQIASAEQHLTTEIEELLSLLGLSQSMIEITNQMLTPPEGHWETPPDHRAIINPGGVGQPRDGDPRAAFMIYDSERGFEFYRIPYDFETTQDKILKAGLPPFLAVRLAYGR